MKKIIGKIKSLYLYIKGHRLIIAILPTATAQHLTIWSKDYKVKKSQLVSKWIKEGIIKDGGNPNYKF